MVEKEMEEKVYKSIIKTIKDTPLEEFYTSGHRTCQGCESALVMRFLAKAAGQRTIVIGATGCMYVANTTYYSTSWIVPWVHTQLGGSGAAALGTAAALRALMRKGKIKQEPINVIAFCGDLGCADMGLSGVSNAMTYDYNLLIVLYDNESSANTDIQETSMTPYGAQTSFSRPGKQRRIMKKRWKKSVVPMIIAGHRNIRYAATMTPAYPLDSINKIKKALAIGGPTFIHSLDPCPKGWDYDPRFSHELGVLAAETGLWPLYEYTDGEIAYNEPTKSIVEGRMKRKPVKEYLEKQGRFSHFTEEDIEYIQRMVDEMYEEWEIPGVMPIKSLNVKISDK
ncbi:thiamine pyrophosphate-dependent enzyme [Saccharolobus islandicus]|uniref:thiamine pyrophosphate-dependent enzyme n=1 Tax=Saccharolobus islandicus TaxID=43080 RepID=UPI003D7D021E